MPILNFDVVGQLPYEVVSYVPYEVDQLLYEVGQLPYEVDLRWTVCVLHTLCRNLHGDVKFGKQRVKI